MVRDETAQTITYHDAWMEMWGVPVFYTPYFRHADVGVKRQSGLLNPGFSVSSGSLRRAGRASPISSSWTTTRT